MIKKHLLLSIVTSLFLLCTSSAIMAEEKGGGLADMASKAASALEAVDINTATAETLGAIPAIGEDVAKAITTYRDTHGKFKTAADLLKVDGVDANLLKKIKPLLTM